mgnify:FL=1
MSINPKPITVDISKIGGAEHVNWKMDRGRPMPTIQVMQDITLGVYCAYASWMTRAEIEAMAKINPVLSTSVLDWWFDGIDD